MARKRGRDDEEEDGENAPTPTPKKLRSAPENGNGASLPTTPSKTAGKNGIRVLQQPGGKLARPAQDTIIATGTPKSQRQNPNSALVTPSKQVNIVQDDDEYGDTITVVRNADRSARRKTTRNFIQRTVEGLSDDELEDPGLEGQIIGQEEDDEDREGSQEIEDVIEVQKGTRANVLDTPKRGRGRPKGSKRKRTPTPPPNLPAHETYFFDNRPSAAKSSSNTLSSVTILSHSAYHNTISTYADTHAAEINDLHDLHSTSFPLWTFELSQGYSLLLYGYGSKRHLLSQYASYLYTDSASPPTIIILNGHHPSLTLRTLLTSIARAILPSSQTLPTNPSTLLSLALSHLSSHPPPQPIYILISSIHTRALTIGSTQSILSQLASHPSVNMVCTADTPSFPLLHPTRLRDAFNFLYHDTTTFSPYDVGSVHTTGEVGPVVDTVLELMGRKTASAVGREGVRWVLRSLPENARGLYRLLVEEILAGADANVSGPKVSLDEGGSGSDDETTRPGPGKRSREAPLPGVEARILYNKAVQEFLCSSEMSFRGLLKEFMDHRMVSVLGEGVGGGEVLGIEMGREELTGVLEDLVEGV